jgi:hypothetical protein
MSTNGVPPLFATISASIRAGMWFTLLAVMATTSLIIVALTVASDGASAAGTDAGRMAFSFVIFLVLVALLLGIPTVFISIRERLGQLPFLNTVLLALAVGLSFVAVSIPAMVWAILSTGVSADVWLPVIGTTVLEVGVVAVLVALAHWALKSGSVATVTAFGLIAGITVGPLLVVAGASLTSPIEQTTKTYYIEWKDENEPVDPETGYPINPTCQKNPSVSTTYQADYTGVWAVVATNPIALVSASITPALGPWQNNGYQGDGWESEPVRVSPELLPLDVFSAVDLNVRGMQLPIETDIVIDECANLAIFGTPYMDLNGERTLFDVLNKSTSGYTAGVIGQLSYLVVATAILVPIRLRGRRS